jgi:hypothetical protein
MSNLFRHPVWRFRKRLRLHLIKIESVSKTQAKLRLACLLYLLYILSYLISFN